MNTTQTIPGGINPSYITPYSSGIINVINYNVIPVLLAIAFLMFLWGAFKYYIYKGDSETDRKTGHQVMLWGVIGFVVIFSLWGLVNLVGNVFGLSFTTPAPKPPVIQ